MQAWDSFLHTLEVNLGKKAVDQWVRSLTITQFDARNIYLQTDDPLKITWFNEYLKPYLKKGLLNNNGKRISVHLALETKAEQKEQRVPKESSFQIAQDRLDPELTFENFVQSQENQIAYNLLYELKNPEFNPIFIYGKKHTGKTHLLNATAFELQKQKKNAFYVRAESFTSHVVQAIRLGRMLEFRNIYRNIDVILIDDIDFLAKKAATQEEFFHTFNALQTVGKQIVLSASQPPSKLIDIEQRLLSRFEWGISLEIQAIRPIEILRKKAALWNLSYSDEILEFLAKTFTNDSLIALQALVFRTKGKHLSTIEIAKSFLQDLIAKNKAESLSFDKIISKVSAHFRVSAEDILGKSQMQEHATPRKMAMFLTRTKLKMPFQKIGKMFGRDHSTVMSSVKQIQKGIDEKKIPFDIL